MKITGAAVSIFHYLLCDPLPWRQH